jgi:hypothetical protein
MDKWLVVTLLLSIIYSYFISVAYFKLLKDYNYMKELHDELEKIYGSIDRLAAKRKKIQGKR